MGGLYIYRYTLKLFLKDYKSMAVTLVFPLVLTWIFVTVFTGLASSQSLEARILVQSEGEGALTSQYSAFLEGVSSSSLTLELVSQENQADLLAIVDERNQTITLKKSKASDMVMQSVLRLSRTFSDQMHLVTLQKQPLKLSTQTMSVQTKGLEDIARSITNTMLIFVAMLGGQYAINQTQSHSIAKGRRMSISPVKPVVRIMGEYLAGATVILLELMILLFAFEGLFHIGYRQYWDEMLMFIAVLSLTCTGLGSFIGAWIKDGGAADALLSMLVALTCIASGGLMPNMSELAISKFSPVSWIISDLEKMLEGMGMEQLWQCMGIMLGLTICFMTLTWYKLRREAIE